MDVCYNLGVLMDQQGRTDEALRHYAEAVRRRPISAKVPYDMGNLLVRLGRTDEAAGQFVEALRRKGPDDLRTLACEHYVARGPTLI